MEDFKKELTTLINYHSIENIVDVPDFILAEMICEIIKAMGPSLKQNLKWHTKGNIPCNTLLIDN